MMRPSKHVASALVLAASTTTACFAFAEEPPAPAAPPPADDAAEAPDEDGARFRGGVSLGGGALIWNSLTAGVGSVDGRFGVQIMDLLGIYVQPQLALGADSNNFAGSVGGSLLAEATFIDHIFVGAGGGAGLVQYGGTDGAGHLIFRAGGYPLMGYGEDGIRRKGLMLGADVRIYFVAGEVLVSPVGSIGYEAF